MEILYVVGFFCGVQNVVGGAAYQVLLAQLAGRKRLVEANAKVALGETSAALVGPGVAGGLIQMLTAPFAILLDAFAFFASALMLRNVHAPNDVPHDGPKASVTAEIGEGLKLVWGNRTLFALAWLSGLWQFLHHMQIAVLILFATRELHLSAGAIGLTYMFGGLGCVIGAAFAERLSARFGVGPVIVHGLILTALAWQAFGLIGGPVWVATILLGLAMLVFDFGGVLYGINYLSLRQAITPDRLLGRMTATMRFLTVAVGADRFTRGRRAGHVDRAARHAVDRRCAGFAAVDGCRALVAGPAPSQAACRRRRVRNNVRTSCRLWREVPGGAVPAVLRLHCLMRGPPKQGDVQSALMPAAFTTRPYLARSFLSCAPKASGVPGVAAMPSLASCATISGRGEHRVQFAIELVDDGAAASSPARGCPPRSSTTKSATPAFDERRHVRQRTRALAARHGDRH